MATGFTRIPFAKILPEQILAYFGISLDDTNKCICPFHEETQPSMQVNQEYVYCYGCKWSGDTWRLVKELSPDTNVGQFLQTANFPSPSGRTYRQSKYIGSVRMELIDYWHTSLLERPELIEALQQERWLSLNTVNLFKLGYRPDTNEWVIPFIYNSEVETVQFRSRKTNQSESKYRGLAGHSKGCIINRSILDTPHDYVVILMGVFDPQLAYQDGLNAVGMNGSMPFKKTEKERVQQMFSQQTIKFIVPDNNPVELKEAQKLAEWIDGDVRCFPITTPHNTDYIDYRQSGKTVEDFKCEVLGVMPFDSLPNDLLNNLISLYDVGDEYGFAQVYLELMARGLSYSDAAIELANKHITNAVSKRILYNVKCKEDFIRAMRYKYISSGGW